EAPVLIQRGPAEPDIGALLRRAGLEIRTGRAAALQLRIAVAATLAAIAVQQRELDIAALGLPTIIATDRQRQPRLAGRLPGQVDTGGRDLVFVGGIDIGQAGLQA